MDLSYFTLFTIIIMGFVLSAAVWILGHVIRRRIRGPARVVMMTAMIVLWYIALMPLIQKADLLNPETKRAYLIGVHSIWLWWVWAVFAFIRRATIKAGRTNIKTGLFHATGVPRITQELRRTRELKRIQEERRAKAAGDSPTFTPDI